MEQNEPTTGEIVRALRCIADAIECKDCRYKYPVGNVILCDHEQMNGNAADRLERQEQTIAALTARAEKAERERDAAKAYMKRFGCLTCTGQGTLALNDPCGSCRDKSKWEMRGLPQDGEGK